METWYWGCLTKEKRAAEYQREKVDDSIATKSESYVGQSQQQWATYGNL